MKVLKESSDKAELRAKKTILSSPEVIPHKLYPSAAQEAGKAVGSGARIFVPMKAGIFFKEAVSPKVLLPLCFLTEFFRIL